MGVEERGHGAKRDVEERHSRRLRREGEGQ